MKITERKTGEIKPYEQNAKRHPDSQINKIVASIREFGFNQPIVVDRNDTIIVGHGRFIAAQVLGLDRVPVLTVDLTEEQARAYRLADNKLAESEWDMEVVIKELQGLSGDLIDLTGFDKDEFEGKALADEIAKLARDRGIDSGQYTVVTVEAPETPRLKARASFYFENKEEFDEVKRFFDEKHGELDCAALLKLIRKTR